MPRYFAVKPTTQDASRTFADADRLAESMHPSLASLNVRVVAVRPRDSTGFVFAISARSPLDDNSVVSRLRAQPAFDAFRISRESENVEGPFVWH
jgi:hypothetical protein